MQTKVQYPVTAPGKASGQVSAKAPGTASGLGKAKGPGTASGQGTTTIPGTASGQGTASDQAPDKVTVPGVATGKGRAFILILIHGSKKINTPVVALSLDAEKAFDHLKWPFLLAVLQKMNFGQNLIQMIKMLYLNPSALI